MYSDAQVYRDGHSRRGTAFATAISSPHLPMGLRSPMKVRFCEGFRMPALARALMQGCRLGPASESLQGRKPRVGEALDEGRRLWGFGDWSSGGEQSW